MVIWAAYERLPASSLPVIVDHRKWEAATEGNNMPTSLPKKTMRTMPQIRSVQMPADTVIEVTLTSLNSVYPLARQASYQTLVLSTLAIVRGSVS